MTTVKILEEIIPPSLSAYAKARYIKIYKSPRNVHVFDMMHHKGLRICFDIEYETPTSVLIDNVIKYAQEYRPASYSEIADEIIFVAKFTADVLSVDGKLTPYEIGSGKLQTRWCQMMLADFLKKIRMSISYERAVELLDEFYAATGT